MRSEIILSKRFNLGKYNFLFNGAGKPVTDAGVRDSVPEFL